MKSDLEQREIAELVRRFLSGEAGAFDSIYHAFKHRLYRVAAARMGTGADAEDCVQEAFMRAARYLKGYDHARSFSGWILRIVQNVIKDRLERRGACRLLLEEELAMLPAPAQELTDRELLANISWAEARAGKVRVLLSELPDDQRRRVDLFYFQGLSHSEMAAALGDRSEEASRQKLKRIRDLLRARLLPDAAEGTR